MRKLMAAALLIFVLFLILAACGQPATDEQSSGHAEAGDSGNAHREADAPEPEKETFAGRIAAGFPGDMPVYSHSQIEESTKQGDAFTVSMKTGDTIGDVWGFYAKAMAGRGWNIGSGNFDEGEGQHQYFKSGNEAAVDLYDEGDGTRIEIIVAPVSSFPRR